MYLKFVFNFFLLTTFSQASPLVQLSGRPSPLQEKVVKKFLYQENPTLGKLSQWNKEEECIPQKKVILHICFQNGRMWISKSQQRLIANTLGKVLTLEGKNQKALHQEELSY